MSDKSQTQTRPRLSLRLWIAYHLAVQVERIDETIAFYAAAGLSGTAHDVEHHQMRDAARKELKEKLEGLNLS